MDIDPAEVGKNRTPDIPIVGDVKRVLQKLNGVLAANQQPEMKRPRMEAARVKWWNAQIRDCKAERPYDRLA